VIQVLADGRVSGEREHGEEKHQKPNPQAASRAASSRRRCAAGVEGAIWNPGSKKGDRIGSRRSPTAKRVRFFKSNGEMLDGLTRLQAKSRQTRRQQKQADKHAEKQADTQAGKQPEAPAHRVADQRSGPPRLQQH